MAPKKTTSTKSTAAAENISTDGHEETPHVRGMPAPRNKRKSGDGSRMLSAEEVAELHGADVLAENEKRAKEIRAKAS